MTPDYRALCAELLTELENAIRVIRGEDGTRHISSAEPVITKAYAALVQEQQWPTDRELLELMPESMRDEFSYAARQCSAILGEQVKPGIFRVALNTAALEYARAVFARWGGAAPQPVPMTERLSEPADCDEQSND